jgi:hypothetical protein
LASYESYRRVVLRGLAVAGLGILAGSCLFSANAFADACSDLKSQYGSAFQIYQSSKFQFPDDCARAQDYFRSKREQAQSLVLAFHAASQACGSQFAKSPEQLVSLLDHEAVTLETGCNVITGMQTTAPAPQRPPPAIAPAAATPPPPQVVAPTAATPPPPNQTPAPPPNQAAAPRSSQAAAQSCAAQKTMPPAPGCNADFPQLLTGAVCTAADNSVGLTLQVPGSEPTCCVTSCGRSK